MFTTLNELPERSSGADVLIVGSGPAGLALALAARERGAQVVLLESGGPRAGTDELNRVDSTALPFPGAFTGRARGFGGTGEKWAGQCLPLDDIDLAERSWVPGSGWPLAPAELEPWIRAAADLYEVADATFSPADVAAAALPLPGFDPELLSWRVPHYSPGHRLGSRVRDRCAEDSGLTVVLDATVVSLVAHSGRVEGVIARSRRGGAERMVLGTTTTLACGGLENARLLLDAGDVIGETSPLVGQGLQDHPYWLVGEVVGAPPELGQVFQSMTVAGRRVRPKVTLSPAQQEARRTLNCIADLELDHGPRSSVGALKRGYDAARDTRNVLALLREVPAMLRDPASVLRELGYRRKGVGGPPDRHTRLLLRVQTEQPPLGPSAVGLSDRTDALGRPMLDVRWEVGEAERHTCIEMADVVGQQLEGLGLGRLEVFSWLEDPAEFRSRAVDFYHHAGTTRMSRDPASGVVDPDCRVHGVEGLYVVGGSVFPASGYAHPTLTIVALALRLADRLANKA